MTFTITAELPLGTYRGRAPDGSLESIPSVARLHAALLSAAGFGPRAVAVDQGLAPSDADEAALRWLEEHPPDSISVPPMQVNTSPAMAYREDGTLAPKKAGTNKLGKSAGRCVAVAGDFSWTWTEPPPVDIVAAIEALCPDVSHLGTTESPVRLVTTADSPSPTHRLDLDADIFAGAGNDVDLPVRGRTAELRSHHERGRTRPSAAKDRVRTAETSETIPAPRSATAPGRYAPVVEESESAPWPQTLVLGLDRTVRGREKLRWAVAAHRGLIRLIGEGAPAVLTGAYPLGAARPTNRIAIQILDPGLPTTLGNPHSSLAIMIPQDAEPTDVAVVMQAVHALDVIRGPRGRVLRPTLGRAVAGHRFWRPPAPGTLRLWRTDPVAIPDTRGATPEWTFTHAALLSLGFVWQGSQYLPRVSGRGAERDRRLVDSVNAAGAVVVDSRPVFTSSVQDFVHHVHPDAVVRPYEAVIGLGDLGGPGVLQAIGQSRHLGGGLLVPVDVPEGAQASGLLGEARR